MTSKNLADTYSIVNAFAKIGSNFLQIQSKNAEWFHKTSNWRWSVKYQRSYPHSQPPPPPQSPNIPFPSTTLKLNAKILTDEPKICKEPIIGMQESIQQSNKEVTDFWISIIDYVIFFPTYFDKLNYLDKEYT